MYSTLSCSGSLSFSCQFAMCPQRFFFCLSCAVYAKHTSKAQREKKHSMTERHVGVTRCEPRTRSFKKHLKIHTTTAATYGVSFESILVEVHIPHPPSSPHPTTSTTTTLALTPICPESWVYHRSLSPPRPTKGAYIAKCALLD